MEGPRREELLRPPPLQNPNPSPPVFFPATPGLLYRSAFSEECEALALRAATAGPASPTPLRPFGHLRLPSTIESETLTPLWTSSILNDTFAQAAPPPSSPSRTFCNEGKAEALEATYLVSAEASACSSGLHRTFEWEAATLVTSTPAPQAPQAPQAEEMNANAGSGSGLRLEEEGCSQGKASSKKRHLSPGSRPPGCPAPEKTIPRKSARGKASGGGPTKKEDAGVARPNLGKNRLPNGMKNGLAKVPQETKSALSTQLHSQHTRKSLLGNSVACQGPKLQGENKPSRTKLPVPAGLYGRPIGGALVAAGQIPRDAPGRASCLQCRRLLQENQLLAEEIQHLKTLLENCQGRTAT